MDRLGDVIFEAAKRPVGSRNDDAPICVHATGAILVPSPFGVRHRLDVTAADDIEHREPGRIEFGPPVADTDDRDDR